MLLFFKMNVIELFFLFLKTKKSNLKLAKKKKKKALSILILNSILYSARETSLTQFLTVLLKPLSPNTF